MKINCKEDVSAYHGKFGPFTIAQQQAAVEEACKELAIAILQGDRVSIARECVDLRYAMLGWSAIAGVHPLSRAVLTSVPTPALPARKPYLRVLDLFGSVEEWLSDNRSTAGSVADILEHVDDICDEHNIPLAEVWHAVHAANMRKVSGKAMCYMCGTIRTQSADCHNCGSKLERGKPTKPPGWVGPDVAGVLGLLACACPATSEHYDDMVMVIEGCCCFDEHENPTESCNGNCHYPDTLDA